MSLVCVVCGKTILPGDPYQAGLDGKTAHLECCEAVLQPEEEDDGNGH